MIWLLSFLGGCTSVSAEGRLVDGLTGEPLAGTRIVAHATLPDPRTSCPDIQAITTVDGAFHLERSCDVPYAIGLPDRRDRWLADTRTLPPGDVSGLEVRAWPAPEATGIYRLSGDTLEALRASTELRSEPIKESADRAVYPRRIPHRVPRIGPDDVLALVGREVIAGTRFDPLIPSGPRLFGDDAFNVRMDPWSYVGMRFTDDRTFERVDAAIDSAHVLDKADGDRAVRYLRGAALPPGRYVVHWDGSELGTILDVGTAPTDPADLPPSSP